MAEFLSSGWITALDEAARASERLAEIGRGTPLVIEQRIVTPSGTDRCYHLVFDEQGARVVDGEAAEPDVVLVCDIDTAHALHLGTTNAQRAITEGRLTLRGHVDKLLRNSDGLAALGDVFANMRSSPTGSPPEAE